MTPIPASAALDALAGACSEVRPGEPEEGVLGVQPGCVATPATIGEASEVLRAAARLGLAVVPRGAETRLDWGSPPDRCDLLIDTRRLDRVVEHAAGDLVVKAEAGVPLDRLAEVLAGHRQRLALDAPLPGSTVGGTVATGASGPLRLLYGTPRDLVIGLTVVRADGEITKSGGKVVKNVAGYDLGRLFAGSYGTLGLIVEATFRLHPVPAARAFLAAEVAGAAAADEAVREVLHSPAAPSAVEVDAPPGGPVTVGVLVEGVPNGVAARAARLRELFGAGAGTGGGTAASETPPDWWGRYPDGTTLIELTGPRLLADLPPAAGGTVALRVSAGGEHGFAALPAGTTPDRAAEVLAALRAALAPRGGTAVVRYAPEAVRERIDLWGPAPALHLMRRVKDQFDPEHRMSPGRFVGGI